MTYPGNPSVSQEVQQRIRNTFEQTLDLAATGKRQEASLGCDFILQLDPRFRPAQTLKERLETTEGEVPVDDLRDALAGRPSREEQAAEAAALFEDTKPGTEPADAVGGGEESSGEEGLGEDLDAGLPALEDLPDLDLPEPGPEPAAGETPTDLGRRMEGAFQARDFDTVLELAQAHVAAVQADPELSRLATAAGERREAAPFVERFVASAGQALERGDTEEAAAQVKKARSLDPDHPEVRRLAGELAGGGAAEEEQHPPDDAGPDPSEPDLPDLEPPAPTAPDDDEPPSAQALTPDGEDAGDELDLGASEEDQRIAELLEEGQGAFERGDYQGAIDAWSRIFLIDIDHPEASERIEEARRRKNEQERKVEETYHEALRKLKEESDVAGARRDLEAVLRMAPSHAGARERLDRIEAGESAAPADVPAGESPPAPTEPSAPQPPAPPQAEEELKEEILVPPEPGEEVARSEGPSTEKPPTMVARSRGTSRRFLLIAGAVLVLVLVGAFFLYENWEAAFPNADEVPAAPAVDPIARATRLHEAGKTAMAVSLLRRLTPSSPRYEEAQALISQWEAAGRPEETAAADGDGEAERARRATQRQQRLLDEAAAAAEESRYLRANELLQEAASLNPLPEGNEALVSAVEAGVAPLQGPLNQMQQGDPARALPTLWRMLDETPSSPDVRRLIADAYYDLALDSLQQGDAATAAQHLEEALSVVDDPALQRHLRFARTYSQREKDLLYRIYVKYLPPR